MLFFPLLSRRDLREYAALEAEGIAPLGKALRYAYPVRLFDILEEAKQESVRVGVKLMLLVDCGLDGQPLMRSVDVFVQSTPSLYPVPIFISPYCLSVDLRCIVILIRSTLILILHLPTLAPMRDGRQQKLESFGMWSQLIEPGRSQDIAKTPKKWMSGIPPTCQSDPGCEPSCGG